MASNEYITASGFEAIDSIKASTADIPAIERLKTGSPLSLNTMSGTQISDDPAIDHEVGLMLGMK